MGIGNVVVTLTNGCIDFILIYFHPLNSVKRVLLNENDYYFVNRNDIICVMELYFFYNEVNVWKYKFAIQ